MNTQKEKNFEDDPIDKYIYNPNLDEIFNVANDIEEMKGEDFIVQTAPLDLM